MHDHASITIESWGVLDWLCYFIYGNGLWMNSWHCTSQDVYALVFRSACCIYMASQYCRYTNQWRQNFKGEPNSPTKIHSRWLRIVLLWCMSIHILGSIVFIFVPIHYIMGVMFLVNGIQCHLLCRSNLQRLTHDRWHDGEAAIRTQDQIANDFAEVDKILAQQSHAATIEMVNDTSRTFAAVREVLDVAKERLDQTRKTKVSTQ